MTVKVVFERFMERFGNFSQNADCRVHANLLRVRDREWANGEWDLKTREHWGHPSPVSRFIVGDRGVGLSMLQNISSLPIYEKYERRNRGFGALFVT